MADVVVEVEMIVVDPDRMTGAGTYASRCRYRGMYCSLREDVGLDPIDVDAAVGAFQRGRIERSATPATCMWLVWVSSARNEASR